MQKDNYCKVKKPKMVSRSASLALKTDKTRLRNL